MSASLVGSEMCIRDRLCAAYRADSESDAERGCSGGADGRWGSEGAPRSCLLYTSDAADDM
eukprot:9000084-Alexandrium_andersonii.AAC.1